MRKRAGVVILAAALCAAEAVAAARVAFERTIPAPQNPTAATDFTLIYAIGDNVRINTFLDSFVDQANRSDVLRLLDATTEERVLFRGQLDQATIAKLRKRFPAEIYVRVTAFTCRSTEKSGEGGAYDYDGKRVRRPHKFVDATCTATLELLSADTFTRTTLFEAKGEGTSPRDEQLSPDAIAIAIDQAARYAGVSAAEQITPRRIRESISLMEDAPGFAEGMAMIEANRLEDARRIWSDAAKRAPDSAALRFNLAAISEAVGDLPAATREYEVLRRLAPEERRYRVEFEMFRRRNGITNEKRR